MAGLCCGLRAGSGVARTHHPHPQVHPQLHPQLHPQHPPIAAAEGVAVAGGFCSTHNEGGRGLHTRSYTRSPLVLPCPLLRGSVRSRILPTPRHRTGGPERPRGPVTNFLTLSPRRRGSASAALAAHFAAPARTHARTRAHGRPTTNDATCGPPAWLTGRLHDGGIRSVRLPLRRSPLLAIPIATPLQGGRPKRSGLLFLKKVSSYFSTIVTRLGAENGVPAPLGH